VPPGDYYLEVAKPDYTFPAKIKEKNDGQYHQVYTGETLTITKNQPLVSANIPITRTQ